MVPKRTTEAKDHIKTVYHPFGIAVCSEMKSKVHMFVFNEPKPILK